MENEVTACRACNRRRGHASSERPSNLGRSHVRDPVRELLRWDEAWTWDEPLGQWSATALYLSSQAIICLTAPPVHTRD